MPTFPLEISFAGVELSADHAPKIPSVCGLRLLSATVVQNGDGEDTQMSLLV